MVADERADLVVVGAGTVGSWAATFAAEDGAGRVVVLERGLAGQGASSRAAGIVRQQGGTPVAVALGRWSVDFYLSQPERYGTDSGFQQHGYLMLDVTEGDVEVSRARIAMQRAAGLDVRWVDAGGARALNPTLGGGFVGASYAPGDGAIDPPRNVRAAGLAMQRAGVELRERTACTGLRLEPAPGGGSRVTGLHTASGTLATDRVLLTGGPSFGALGEQLGLRFPVGAARHQVAVTAPAPAFADAHPMVFDVAAGLYWRPEEGGVLFGFSNPRERPGEAREIDWPYLDEMRRQLSELVPATEGLGLRKAWAATIDFTADHLPILGPALTPEGTELAGVTVASPAGHGMMWGPAVARVAADLALEGRTDLVDVADLGLDRFDPEGRSRLATDPIALPFPTAVGAEPVVSAP